jgi:hypothetical protein
VLYLDSSALAKRYLAEAYTSDVTAAMAVERILAISAIGYAELRGAFARAFRERRLTSVAHASVVALVDSHWARYLVLAADDGRMREAGRLIDHHAALALRAFDAIHLASALRLADGNPAAVTFACWDVRLWRAARDEGFALLPPTEPT